MNPSKVKRCVLEVIQPDCASSALSSLFDTFITMLILSSGVSVLASTFELPISVQKAFLYLMLP